MKLFLPSGSPWATVLPLLLLPLLAPQPLRATGFEEPSRWLDSREGKPLQTPEFYFELEAKRLAAELRPPFPHVGPALDEEREPNYTGQTYDADLTDFAEALKSGALRPPDAVKAEAAHEAMRDFIGSATRAAPDGEPASDAGSPAPEEFPSEFADYHLGARAYRSGNYETAGIAWEALLTRPAAERRFRTVWAMFMIGKTAIEQERWDDAVAWFGKTRGAAREGFKDSIGLAAASLGWEAQAHLRAGRLSESARAYLEQLAAGDIGAVRSLRIVLQEIEMKEIPGAELAGDPILQRLKIAQAVAFLMPYPGEKIDPDPAQNPALAWLRALEAIGAKNVRDADRVAWLAYAQGDYAGAVRWLARAEEASPSTLWLRAKLALREGKLAAAATLLSEALPKLPATPPLETRYTPADAMPPDAAARADLGALRLARGDYLAALKLFLDAGLPFDAEYLAEGVLTVAELKGFVDRECPPKQKSAPKPAPAPDGAAPGAADADEDEPNVAPPNDPRGWHYGYAGEVGDLVRRTLARRMVRAGRLAEARPYFGKDEQAHLGEYAALIERTKRRDLSRAEQAEALEAAAHFVIENCSTLFEISEVELQAARLSGREVSKAEYPAMTLELGDKVRFAPDVAKGERERLKTNTHRPLKHSLSLHVAADLAWRAAALLPDNDDRTAKLLNEAGSWLKLADDAAADRFYQAIERRCARTELGKEAIKRRWFVPVEQPKAED